MKYQKYAFVQESVRSSFCFLLFVKKNRINRHYEEW